MFCTKCEKELPKIEGMQNCPFCGAKIKVADYSGSSMRIDTMCKQRNKYDACMVDPVRLKTLCSSAMVDSGFIKGRINGVDVQPPLLQMWEIMCSRVYDAIETTLKGDPNSCKPEK